MTMLTLEEKQWVDATWHKLVSKMEKVAVRSYDKLPYTTVDGVHTDEKETAVTKWTNSFFAGMLWHLYADTKKEVFRNTAEHSEELLDKAFEKREILHHDVGFLWNLSSVANYRLTGSERSYSRAIDAVEILAGRFVPEGSYIRAWDYHPSSRSIIDTMMNLSLLFWASEAKKDDRFKEIAMANADMTMENHIRPDGSVIHIIYHDPETGGPLEAMAGQGYSKDSSWSRGQSWAIYGFALAYIHTGKQEYLDTAKKVAHYFIAAVSEDYLPKLDLRCPEEPVYYDSTSGMIAACGLIELSRLVSEFEKKLYFRAAMRLLRAMEARFCDWNEDTDAVVTMGSERYDMGKFNLPIIYGDFFFTEALYKLRGNTLLFW